MAPIKALRDVWNRCRKNGFDRASIGGWVLLSIPIIATPFIFLLQEEDSSYVGTSNKAMRIQNQQKESMKDQEYSSVVSEKREATSELTKQRKASTAKIKYRAKQVILRESDRPEGPAIPNGTNLIGTLLSHIDTRTKEKTIRVLIPYGGGDRWSNILPENTIILAKANYSGHGDRVSLDAFSAQFPDGSEHTISAIALDSSNFAPGIRGEAFSNIDTRVASGLALTMISAGTDVLTEKESLGNSSEVTPKATMKNAALQGVGKISDLEANRRLSQLTKDPEYVEIEPGKDVIISLTEPFRVRKI